MIIIENPAVKNGVRLGDLFKYLLKLSEVAIDTTRPCSCGGTNERCYKCDGTGFLQAVPTTGAALRNTPQKKSANYVERDPYWARPPVRATVIDPQQRRPNPAKSTRVIIDLSQTSKSFELVRDGVHFARCHNCSYYIPVDGLQEHIKRCLDLDKKRSPHVAPARKQPPKHAPIPKSEIISSPGKLVSCEFCKCSLKAKNLKRHLEHVHQIGIARRQVPINTHKEQDQTVYFMDRQQVFNCDSRDAGKYIGHVARDHGSFGSMPSYDDFSDEGTPE